MNKKFLEKFLLLAIKEDIGDGDHTSLATIPKNHIGKAWLMVKENGIIAGVEVAHTIFHIIDKRIIFHRYIKDGFPVQKGDIVFEVKGRSISLLQAERLVLNIMQRMSGIATQTRAYVEKIDGLHTKIIDTRKTGPGMRMLEKEAVRLGGGDNHRMGLYDMILIKDNHIDFSGGITNAINKTQAYLKKKKKNLQVVIEARSLDDIKEIMAVGHVNRILIDNFSPEQTKKAVELINGKYKIESSGNINLANVRQYAECGVDYISIGSLTHKVSSLDLSLKAVVEK